MSLRDPMPPYSPITPCHTNLMTMTAGVGDNFPLPSLSRPFSLPHQLISSPFSSCHPESPRSSLKTSPESQNGIAGSVAGLPFLNPLILSSSSTGNQTRSARLVPRRQPSLLDGAPPTKTLRSMPREAPCSPQHPPQTKKFPRKDSLGLATP